MTCRKKHTAELDLPTNRAKFDCPIGSSDDGMLYNTADLCFEVDATIILIFADDDTITADANDITADQLSYEAA